MEFVDQSLEDLLQEKVKRNNFFAEFETKMYVFQVLQALADLHAKSTTRLTRHRAPGPEARECAGLKNALREALRLRQCESDRTEWGQHAVRGLAVLQSARALAVGSASPSGITDYHGAIDVWAAGCILAEIVNREPLFQGASDQDQLLCIFRCIGSPTDLELKGFASRVQFDGSLLFQLPRYPQTREDSFKKLFTCFKDKANLFDLLNQMLCYLPENRITARNACMHPFFDEVRLPYAQLVASHATHISSDF